jgi:hypothetical protein
MAGVRAFEAVYGGVRRYIANEYELWQPLVNIVDGCLPRLQGRSILELFRNLETWPDVSELIPQDSQMTFKVPGGTVLMEELNRFSHGDYFISGSIVNLVLASLAAERMSPIPSTTVSWVTGPGVAILAPWVLPHHLSLPERVSILISNFNHQETSTLVIPANIPNLHWCDLVLSFTNKTVELHDSLSGLGKTEKLLSDTVELAQEVCKVLDVCGTWTGKVLNVLQQEFGSNNCALHTLACCILTSSGLDATIFTHHHLRNMRCWILLKIFQLYLDDLKSNAIVSSGQASNPMQQCLGTHISGLNIATTARCLHGHTVPGYLTVHTTC